jgi:zinc/manganese transport system substrate-binding protein
MGMRSARSRVVAVIGAVVALLLVGGCSSGSGGGPGGGSPANGGGRTLTVVASTNVWGSVVGAIAGPGVTVDSIISDPNADPHSYESTPADAAALSRADLIVANGGGYDEFVTKALDADPNAKSKAIEAFGLRSDQGDDNEHVWFDPAAVKGVVTQVTDRLVAIEPAQADALHQRAAAFTAKVDDEAAKLAGIGRAKPGATVLSTEPIAHYLLRTAGVGDSTPEQFVEAVENENDPAPAMIAQVNDTLTARRVGALVFNPQTETPVTQQIRDTAQRAGVPVVQVTETLPEGQDYLRWLDGNRTSLATALGAPAA